MYNQGAVQGVAPKPSAARGHKLIGEVLLEAGLIDAAALSRALQVQKTEKMRLGRILVQMGVADDIQLATALSRQLHIPMVRLTECQIPSEVIELVPAQVAENYLAVPFKVQDRSLFLAMADPLQHEAIDDLRFLTQMRIQVAVAPQTDIMEILNRYYPKISLQKDFGDELSLENAFEVIQPEESEERNTQDLLNLTGLPPVVRLTNAILADAIKNRASDVHIEPQRAALVIRFRVDGVLREVMRADRSVHASLVSRVKVLSNLDIAIRRKPQDGRSQVRHEGHTYDLRVATIPTFYGEKVTVRILDRTNAGMRLEDMGLSPTHLTALNRMLGHPRGVLLVTGPTGSGKTSTLYGCLSRLNSPEVNIITVEDPVEYDIAGVNQVQINPLAGLTFASGLRSILRQDPDIVMVGEIRDGETAGIAFQAGQTGHLVLSTLHTNDAPSAVVRLIDLGVEPFLVSDSLLGVMGQRLVRRVCERCKVQTPLSPQIAERLPADLAKRVQHSFCKGAGCSACQQTGFAGRMGVYEVLPVTQGIKDTVSSTVSSVAIRRYAEKEGFRSMFHDGLQKALMGLTSIEEVFRVAPPDDDEVFTTQMLSHVNGGFPFAEPSGSSAARGEAR